MTSHRFASAADAERAFYEAFERADMEGMMAVWARDLPIICVHPGGPRLLGRQAVAASWAHIFGSGQRLRFDVSDVLTTADAETAVHWVHERISFGEQRSLVVATNVYRRVDRGWYMVAHHGSPTPTDAARADRSASPRVH